MCHTVKTLYLCNIFMFVLIFFDIPEFQTLSERVLWKFYDYDFLSHWTQMEKMKWDLATHFDELNSFLNFGITSFFKLHSIELPTFLVYVTEPYRLYYSFDVHDEISAIDRCYYWSLSSVWPSVFWPNSCNRHTCNR